MMAVSESGALAWLRDAVAVELRRRGVRQSEVGLWLGICQSAVSGRLGPNGRGLSLYEVEVIADRLGIRFAIVFGEEVGVFS